MEPWIYCGFEYKVIRLKMNKLDVISDYLVVTIIHELHSMKAEMHQMLMMLLVSLREVDENEFTAVKDGHHDVRVPSFLASKELVQMSRYSDNEDFNMRFLSLLNKWLKEESWNVCIMECA